MQPPLNRDAVALMNGEPIGERSYPGIDPNGSKDIVGRVGIVTRPARGLYLQGGQGLPRDPLSAQLWFRRAAEAGDADSMAALAGMLASGHGCIRDPAQARRWFEAAAKAGHAGAADWLQQHQEPGL